MRMANNILRVSTPTTPVSLKRKAIALDPEEDETDKARRSKMMQYLNPRLNRATHGAPPYVLLPLEMPLFPYVILATIVFWTQSRKLARLEHKSQHQ